MVTDISEISGIFFPGQDVMDMDYPEPKGYVIDPRFGRLPVRLAMGLYYTPEEWKNRRRKILYTPLPGGNLSEKIISKIRYYIAVLRDE